MILLLILTQQLRELLKSPLGYLITSSPEEAIEELKGIVKEENPSMIITVGDVTSYHAYRNGLNPNLMIIDNVIQRSSITPLDILTEKELYLRNRRGTISEDAWKVIKKAMETNETTKIVVDGEEDLLTLVVVLLAPTKSFVIYGQPKKGLVLVRVTQETKDMVRSIVDRMEHVANERLN